jgi:hypothetical protein
VRDAPAKGHLPRRNRRNRAAGHPRKSATRGSGLALAALTSSAVLLVGGDLGPSDLGEALGWYQALGGAVVLAGIFLAQRGSQLS